MRCSAPSGATVYWPSRHKGGEYAWIDTATGDEHVSRWMCEGPKVKPPPRPVTRAPLGLGDQERVLLELSLDDVDGAARGVVVVPAGVVGGPPEEGPDVDVVVAVQRSVRPLEGRRVVVVAPELGPGGDVVDERAQLLALERPPRGRAELFDHAVTSCGTWARSRPGFVVRSECSAASLPRRGSAGAA